MSYHHRRCLVPGGVPGNRPEVPGSLSNMSQERDEPQVHVEADVKQVPTHQDMHSDLSPPCLKSAIACLILRSSKRFRRTVEPIWLVHPRFRHMDRKTRSAMIAKEAEDRAQMQAERSTFGYGYGHLRVYINALQDVARLEGPGPSARRGLRSRSDDGNVVEFIFDEDEENADVVVLAHVTGGRGMGVVRLPDGFDLAQAHGIVVPPAVNREPEPVELSTLLKYFGKLDIYSEFPMADSTKETTPIIPRHQIILRNLECPVCSDLCFPPYLSCDNGHIICESCRIRIFDRPRHLPQPVIVGEPSCPSCRKTGPLTKMLNGVFTNLISEVEFKCRQYQVGCNKVLNGSNYLAHVEDECTYRRWKCPYCVDQLTLETAVVHLIGNHDQNFGFSSLLTDLQPSDELPVPMKGETQKTCFGLFHVTVPGEVEEHTFMVFQIKTGVLEYAWIVCIIATPAVARTFLVDVKLSADYDMGYNVPKKSVELEWKDIQVLSAQDEMRNIIEKTGLAYSDEEMPFKNFCYPGGKAERVGAKMNIVFKKRIIQEDETVVVAEETSSTTGDDE